MNDKFFHTGEVATVHLMSGQYGDADRALIGIVEAEVKGIVAQHGAPGMVIVRPLRGADEIEVHISQLFKVHQPNITVPRPGASRTAI